MSYRTFMGLFSFDRIFVMTSMCSSGMFFSFQRFLRSVKAFLIASVNRYITREGLGLFVTLPELGKHVTFLKGSLTVLSIFTWLASRKVNLFTKSMAVVTS